MTEVNETQASSKGKKPSHIAYSIRERGEDMKADWKEVGVLFPHKDGQGFDFLYDVLPLNGRVSIRKLEPKKQ